MANLNYISSFINFGQTRAIKRAVPSDLLAKKKQLLFNEGLRPIAAIVIYNFGHAINQYINE